MRTVRSFEALSLALPLALFGCGGDRDREASSPSNTVSYEPSPAPTATAEPSEPSGMTPASGVAEPAPQASPSPKQEFPDAPQPAPLTDPQIAAITDAANSAEVDAAKLALAQSKNPRVKQFAQRMIDHHKKAKQAQSKLVSKLGLSLAESPKVENLRTAATDTERTLKAATPETFDKVYIDIQVADHRMVLDSLDHELIPATQNAELKKALEDFRPKVEAHLNEALEIQRVLMSTPAKGSTGSGSKSTNGTSKSPSETKAPN